MPESIIIYEVRENCAYPEGPENILTVSSEPWRSFQTMASAQLYLQELLNLKLEARTKCAREYPVNYYSSPEALALLAANKLNVNPELYTVLYPEAFKDLPVFFIKEVKVYY